MAEWKFIFVMILIAVGFYCIGFLWGHVKGRQAYREYAIRICDIFNNVTARAIGDTFRKADF